ncbi:Helicase C-terminal [Trinorchestia longiramus]|nr:Helicase C-terminal [Trinorchestia longiramus]
MVGVTQPRRVACTCLAERVSEEQDCLLGYLVGYSIRFDDATSPGITKIKFMTEAILVREMMADPLLRQYSVIMVDEVHERNLYTDIILGLLKKILKRRKDLRIIVCSATIDADHMFQFFNSNLTDDKEKDTAAVIQVSGRTYPVDVHYLQECCADYVKEAAVTAAKIHGTQPPGDVLVFLTGVEEVEVCSALTTQHLSSMSRRDGPVADAIVYPLHGSLPASHQLRAFQRAGPEVRKIIVATNIAETSVTIPGVVYVVDCGFVKLRVYSSSPTSAGVITDGLSVVAVSQASAVQRAGRAGRTRPGKVYRLFPESEFSGLPVTTPPEMVRTNLSPAVLNLLALGIENMLRFDFPSPPPAKHLIAALDELYALSALDDSVQLTEPVGRRMAEMPLSPHLSKMLLVSENFGCSAEAAVIVALLQVQGIFVTPAGKSQLARVQHCKFQVEEGDLVTLLNVYTAWQRHDRSKQWCSKHFVSHKALCRAEEIRTRICSLLVKWDVVKKDETEVSSSTSAASIRRCITAGMFMNAAYLHHSGEYRMVRGNTSLAVHPSSVLYTAVQPKWVVFHEVLHTNRAYMRDLTVIEESWLMELAPHYYRKGRDHEED